MLISKNDKLNSFLESIRDEKFIAIDTEFQRKNTYFPVLCLIQIACKNHVVIIDALSNELDFGLLTEIFLDKNIIKIFHSAKQDIETIYYKLNCIPNNIFDTQVAENFINAHCNLSYEAIVSKYLNVTLDKSLCVSDWTKRPLTHAQIDYAKLDVIYLYKIYPLILENLEKLNRAAWMHEEMKLISSKDSTIPPTYLAWKKLKNDTNFKINGLIRDLAKWREEKAKLHNLPRNHFLSESNLFKLAQAKPIQTNEINSVINNLNLHLEEKEELVNLIQSALAEEIYNNDENICIEQKSSSNLFRKMKDMLNIIAKEYNISPSVIATNDDIKDYILQKESALNKLNSGWRGEIFGNKIDLNQPKSLIS